MTRRNLKSIINGFLFYIFIFSITPSYANECLSEFTKTDICKFAKDLADNMAPSLPMQVNRHMSVESIMAIQNTIILVARLNTNRKAITNLYSSRGLKISNFERIMKNNVDKMCDENNPVGAFIRLGGELRYMYKFYDGEIFTTIVKNTCE